MTEQEAFYEHWKTVLPTSRREHIAREAWKAACAWQREQSENDLTIAYMSGLADGRKEQNRMANEMLRMLETIKYLRGIAERGTGREQNDTETVEQFVLGYVKQLEGRK